MEFGGKSMYTLFSAFAKVCWEELGQEKISTFRSHVTLRPDYLESLEDLWLSRLQKGFCAGNSLQSVCHILLSSDVFIWVDKFGGMLNSLLYDLNYEAYSSTKTPRGPTELQKEKAKTQTSRHLCLI